MGRYIRDFMIKTDPQPVLAAVFNYLQSEGYEYTELDGEKVYKKGKGWVTGPSIFKIYQYGAAIRLETWMKYAIAPGLYVGELDTTGFVGSAVKGPWKNRIAHIEQLLSSISMPNNGNFNTYPPNNAYTPVNTAAPSNAYPPVNTAAPTNAYPPVNTFAPTNAYAPNDVYIPRTPFSPDNTVNPASGQQPMPPAGMPVSFKEFTDNYLQPSLKKDLKNVCIGLYICVALNIVLSIIFNPWGLIDVALLAGITTGMLVAKKRVFGILAIILSVIESIMSIIVAATPPIWWLAASVFAFITLKKIDEQYKNFLYRR